MGEQNKITLTLQAIVFNTVFFQFDFFNVGFHIIFKMCQISDSSVNWSQSGSDPHVHNNNKMSHAARCAQR